MGSRWDGNDCKPLLLAFPVFPFTICLGITKLGGGCWAREEGDLCVCVSVSCSEYFLGPERVCRKDTPLGTGGTGWQAAGSDVIGFLGGGWTGRRGAWPWRSQLNFGLAHPGRWHDFLWEFKIKSRDSVPSGMKGVVLLGGWDGPSLLCSETRHPTLTRLSNSWD